MGYFVVSVIIVIIITLFEVGRILANANKNQLTNTKTFIKENTMINKNYSLHTTHPQAIF